MLQTRTDVKAVPCERCRIIRSFIMFVIMLVLLALVAGDKLTYLQFLDAEFFAALIMIVGIIGFIGKLVHWKFFSQSDTETD
jgi:disulfide bond formation protein DsbB